MITRGSGGMAPQNFLDILDALRRVLGAFSQDRLDNRIVPAASVVRKNYACAFDSDTPTVWYPYARCERKRVCAC